jgi:hypothetical protein
MVRDVFHNCGSYLPNLGGDWNAQTFVTSDCSYGIKDLTQWDGLTTENVTLPNLPALHRQMQASSDIAHINQVQHEIEVELNATVEKMPQHQGRRREISIVRADGHCGIGDHHGKSGRCGR